MQSTQVVSSIPGRTRFKLPVHFRHQEDMAQIASHIEKQSGIHSVEYNNQTGSILVHHDTQHELNDIKDIMKDLGIVFADITGAAKLIPLDEKSEQGLDLSSVLPLGLAGLGVYQLLTFGLQLEIIPWYVLIYFAIDSFIRLNSQPVVA